MKPKILSITNPLCAAIFVAVAVISSTQAQTTLGVGDIQVLGVTADANDSFTFVLWKDIATNTVIRFMDQSFTNATVGVLGTENDMSLTFTSAASAGSVIRVEDVVTTVLPSGVTATKAGTLSGISASGDQVFVYQGTAIGSGTDFTGRTALYGFNIADTTFLTTGTADSNKSYLPTSLSGQDASLDSGNFDNADYTGTRTGLTTGLYRAAAANITNFTQNDTRFALSTTQFTIASSASIHWDANGTTAGDGGTGAWDTTTQDRFKNGAAGTTYLHWVNSTSDNDHTAVFGGTAGTVSIAAAGVTASGLTFDVTGYTIQSNTLTLAGNTPTVSVTTAAHSATISSTLAGSTGLTKSGAGTLNITGTNSANIGATSVTAGTLNVGVSGTGSLTSAVTVTNAGSTLGGSGTVTGNVVVNTGAILAPGNSPGVMTVVGTTTLDAGSIFSWELNSDVNHDGVAPEGTRGTNYDGLSTSNLTVASNAIFRVVLTGTASSDLSTGFWDQTQTWDNIFTVSGTTSNAASGHLFDKFEVYNGTTNITLASASEGSFIMNGSTLTWSAVPEPTSALAGLLITAGLLRRRRSA